MSSSAADSGQAEPRCERLLLPLLGGAVGMGPAATTGFRLPMHGVFWNEDVKGMAQQKRERRQEAISSACRLADLAVLLGAPERCHGQGSADMLFPCLLVFLCVFEGSLLSPLLCVTSAWAETVPVEQHEALCKAIWTRMSVRWWRHSVSSRAGKGCGGTEW